MNFPIASPNENMKIDSSISPIAAPPLSSSWPDLFRPSFAFAPRSFKDVDARDKPGHDELATSSVFKRSGNRFASRKRVKSRIWRLFRFYRNGLQQRCRNNTSAIRMGQTRRRKPAMTDFDPALHRMVPQQRWFEDFALGERFVIPSRTMTSAVF